MSASGKLRLARIAWIIAITGVIGCWSALYLIQQNNPNGIVILDQLGPGYRAYWLLAGLAAVFLAISIFLRRRVLAARQQLNEAQALRLLKDLQSDNSLAGTRFFVYLRSFETTGHLKPPFFFTLFVLQRLHTNELESFLALALQKNGPLVGLGLPGENIGAARIRVEDADWKADIQQLLTHATGVLLLPSDHEGTKWEIEFLQKENLLQKTVFIMPPSTPAFDWRAKWQQAAEALQRLTIALPQYSSRGLLFTITQQGMVGDAQPFSLFYRRYLRKSIETLLAQKALSRSGEDAIRNANRESRIVWLYGRWITLGSSLILFVILVWSGLSGVISGRAARGTNPPPPWSTFYDRYNSASEIGSGQSLVDARILLSVHRPLPEGEVDQLANRGLLRVGDSEREMYLLGLGELLSHARDEGTGAALAEGRTSEITRIRTLVQLQDAHVMLWMQARQSAAIAELSRQAVSSRGAEQSPELLQALSSALGAQAAETFARVLTSNESLDDKQVCELIMAGGAALYRLPEPYRAQLAALVAKKLSDLTASTVNIGQKEGQ